MVSLTLLSPTGESLPIPYPTPKSARIEPQTPITLAKLNIVVPYSGKYDRSRDEEAELNNEPLIHDIDEFLKLKNVQGCTNIRPDIGLSDEELMVTTTKELNEIMRKMQISPARAKRIRYERRILRVVASNKSLDTERVGLKEKSEHHARSMVESKQMLADLEHRWQELRRVEQQNDTEIMDLIRAEPSLIHEVKEIFCNCEGNQKCNYCCFQVE
eukprot:maker-scaffold368_size193847-snap-gene-0.40 protein:Tk10004 transcript:maker-scaffold368_size193847-snap-gene-0.40-mRNA-1 annotation:"hydrogenase maturation protein"